MHENREISCASWSKDQDRSVKAINRTADANVQEKSDCAVAPMNRPNEEGNLRRRPGREGRRQAVPTSSPSRTTDAGRHFAGRFLARPRGLPAISIAIHIPLTHSNNNLFLHQCLAFPPTLFHAPARYLEPVMATERQIQAKRSQNGVLHSLVSGTVVLKGESMRRFNDLAAALMRQFQSRNSAETALVRTMTAARWRLLRMWGIQTAGSGAVLAAATFRSMADKSSKPPMTANYNHALAMLLKLREIPNPFSSPPKPGKTILKANPIFSPKLKWI